MIFPFIALLKSIALQYYYINNNINVIINSKKIYIIIGNFLIFIIKYILIIQGILLKNNN